MLNTDNTKMHFLHSDLSKELAKPRRISELYFRKIYSYNNLIKLSVTLKVNVGKWKKKYVRKNCQNESRILKISALPKFI